MRTPGKPLDCLIEPHREMVVIRLIGELDISNNEEFATTAAGAASGGFPRVVLDLRELEFCDSSGLRAMLDLAQSVPTGTRFEVIRGPAPIQRLFAISGLEGDLRFLDAADVGL